MSIETLPFTAFALQSCAAAAPRRGEAQTLTLQPTPASGRASANQAAAHSAPVLRAAVVPAEGCVLTITF
jgi:hypothetical protein